MTGAVGVSDPADISDLIARVALGDRRAFERLYERTSSKLFGIAVRILRDRAEAEDALQEIYVRIWQAAGRYRPGRASPMSWLIAIARNRAIDRLRVRRPASAPMELAEQVRDPEPTPHARVAAQSERARIVQCLERLGAPQSTAIRMAYLEGYSYRELATKLDIPLNTIRTWLRRGLIGLRECLQE